MATLLKCIFGPRLKKMLQNGPMESKFYEPNVAEKCGDQVIRSSKFYEPNVAEKCGDQVIRSLSLMWSLSVYTSPVIVSVLYKRGYFTLEGVVSILKFAAAVGLVLIGSLWLRGIGRWYNTDYTTFLVVLQAAQSQLNRDTKRALMRYDFDFYAWPVEFRWSDTETDDSKPRYYMPKVPQRSSWLERLQAMPCQLLGYVVAHTFGRRMVYPGTVSILQAAMAPMLLQGRSKLVEEHGGERFKLVSREGNSIDVMVVDRRGHKSFRNGDILVICSEGNAGFYEVGIMSTALEAGYSVLGWNHPGFGGSTGVPFPEQEANAMDVVMQYAIHRLKFKPPSIVVFAWSIGGFPATWAAMNYPDIRAVVLDATFDDLAPLAVSKMPASWKPLILRTVKDHMDLNNADQLCKYPGPVLLIRRTEDEMITTEDPPNVMSNRANHLLIKFMQCRYPKLMTESTVDVLKKWLGMDKLGQRTLLLQYRVEDEFCASIIASFLEEREDAFPSLLGDDMLQEEKVRMALYLANQHLVDYKSTHCTPLPKQLFRMPWEPMRRQEVHDGSCPAFS